MEQQQHAEACMTDEQAIAAVLAAEAAEAAAAAAQQQAAAGGAAAGADAASTAPPDAAQLDAQIAEGLNNIDVIRESERNKPYVGELESLESLQAEYEHGSQAFRDQIAGLAGSYARLRRTRGDGNCFFRSFIFRYLEGLLAGPEQEEECSRFLACLEAWKGKLTEAGYDAIVWEDALETLLGLVHAIRIAPTGLEGAMTLPLLLDNFRDDMWSNTCVMLLRFITSAEIKRRSDLFEPFVLGSYEMDVQTFCTRSVDVMGEESDHIHAQALADALRVPVRIIYMSAAHGQGDAPVDIVPEGLSGGSGSTAAGEPPKARVHLLYRPGHYDILYPSSDAAAA